MAGNERVGVAVLGAGLIGVDLIRKIQRSTALECRLVVGRNSQALGLRRAHEMGCATSDGGVMAIVESRLDIGVVFDASNAECHAEHWRRLDATGATLIDLTPAALGTTIVPTVNGADAAERRHLNLVSCGGQAAIPILHAITTHCTPSYIEVVSTGASASAGPATRRNLDEYIETTRTAVRTFTGAGHVKVMVNLSPAQPPPPFRVTMTVLGHAAQPEALTGAIHAAAQRVRAFVPGYAVTTVAILDDRVRVVVEVSTSDDRLPAYAGNLDIINAAAVLLAEQHAATASQRRTTR